MHDVRVFAAEAGAIGSIRAFVQDAFLRHGASDEAIDAAVLCASELATNALLHGDGPISVELELGARARVTVRDANPRLPVPRRPAIDADAGRGLMMVALFADAWGSARDDDGKAVWFEIDLRDRSAPDQVLVSERRRWGRAGGTVSVD